MIGIGFVNLLRTKPIPILKPAQSDHDREWNSEVPPTLFMIDIGFGPL
jgi:hypothetical protein